MKPCRSVWSCPAILFAVLTVVFGGSPLLHAQRMVISAKDVQPVVVETAAISTEITGRIAVTTFDLTFHNPNSRVLEGTFEFPLLDGQRIVRFALDINGALREAVPVEKERGRVVFEEIERGNVDPGLLEHTAGNNYRARVYPIPAKGSRRVVIAYQEDLAAKSASAGTDYRLALDFPGTLKKFALAVSVFGSGKGDPAKASTTLKLDLPAWRENRLLEITRENFDARGILELALPSLGERPRVITEKFDKQEYFYAEVAVPTMKTKARPQPKCIGILWDASASGEKRDHTREFALLEAWFSEIKNVKVKLTAFRDCAAPAESFSVRNGNWQSLRTALEKTIYDGATSFDGLEDDREVDEWLLFSDGLMNYGATLGIEKLPLKAPIHAINASASANTFLLRNLAAQSGGEFADLISGDAKAALQRLRMYSPRILSVERNPQEITEVYPDAGTPVIPGSSLAVTGILRKSSANIRLKVGLNAADAIVLNIPVTSGENSSHLAARAWAVAKIDRLSENTAANREDIRRTSQKFRIVTADTSLIVLETLNDYIRYNIEPPAELHEEWTEIRSEEARERQEETDDYLSGLLTRFENKAQWWEEKFPKGTPPRKTKNDEKHAEAVALSPRVAADAEPSTPEMRSAAEPMLRDAVEERQVGGDIAGTAFMANGIAASRVAADVSVGSDMQNETIELAAFEVTRSNNVAKISLKPWEPKAAYLERLRRTAPAEQFAIYLEERHENQLQPGFYLDVANFFFEEAKDSKTALQILSNLAELNLEDAALLRVLGQRLVQAERPELALPILESVLRIRGEEPQSRRDLALVCAELGQYQRAIDLLWEIIAKSWDDRFEGIDLIVLGELNSIIATCGEKLDLSKIDQRFIKNLPVGLRVVLTWDANDCDIDLWVTDPNGEKTYYGNQLSYQGGLISNDFTEGYGPEEFLLRHPKPGRYTININYFGDHRQNALGPVTAQAILITDFGTPKQKQKRMLVRLDEAKDTLEVGSFEVK